MESSKYQVFYTPQGYCDGHNILPHPGSRDGVQYIPLHQGRFQPDQSPADGHTGLWGMTVKHTALATQALQQPLAQLPTKYGWHTDS